MRQDLVSEYDYVVIGSGFGGSVSALRLAQKGYRVAVLEKGRRYRTEDFPQTNWNLRKYLWLPRLGLYGIQVLTLFRNVFVLSGTGVGGGSLVYANNLLIPPDEVFRKPEWGPGDWKAKLAPYYAKARDMLGAVRCPQVGQADRLLAEVGRELRGEDTFHVNDVGVFFGPPGKTVPDPYFDGEGPPRTGCTHCGACMIGCPVGGKNTLDKNYLYLAERAGARIFPETEATAIRPRAGGGYTVFTRQPTGLRHPRRTFTARGVVLSGGVLGTVKLLQKCRDAGFLPGLSPRLGDGVRTNSEALLGVKANDPGANYSDQIAITSGINPDPTTHIEVVRYNRGSDALALLTTLLTDGGGRMPRALRFLGTALRRPGAFLRSLWPFGWAARTPILLVMQTDENQIRLDFKPRWWRLGWGRTREISTLLHQIIEREGFGDILADGVKRAALRLGKGTESLAVHAGGQELPMHDSRLDPGYAIAYQCEPTPGRHTISSYLYADLFGVDRRFPQARRRIRAARTRTARHVERYRAGSVYMQLINGAGLCLFGALTSPLPVVDYLNAATGWDLPADAYFDTGERILSLRKAFNAREGIKPADQRLNPRALGHPPLQRGPLKGRRLDMDRLERCFYETMGWDLETGGPTQETAVRLGLEKICSI